jgi:predicted DNA-binding protein with PD1-like motif
MNAREAHRTRHLVIRLDRGEELPAALVRALDEAEARSGFITGVGALEAAELAHYDQAGRADKTRRLEAPTEVVSLSGNVALLDGGASVRLSAVLSRETDAGLATYGGQLVWARVFEVELHVVVLDDVALTRIADDRTGLPVLAARAAASAIVAPAARPTPAPEAVTTGETPKPSPPVAAVPTAAVVPAPAPPSPSPPEANAMPQRPQRPKEDLESYPDVGDAVMHFAFGECTVLSSDGDRIRLRQDKDGRVREVALAMLRIEPPALGEDGTRHFKLHRKN